MDRRRSVGARSRGSTGRGPPPARRRIWFRRRLYVGAEARNPDAVDRPRRPGPALDSSDEKLAAERTALRRATRTEQSGNDGEARRGADEDLAAQLRHPAAASGGRCSGPSVAPSALQRTERKRAAVDRVAEGDRRPLSAVLARDNRAGDRVRPAR